MTRSQYLVPLVTLVAVGVVLLAISGQLSASLVLALVIGASLGLFTAGVFMRCWSRR